MRVRAAARSAEARARSLAHPGGGGRARAGTDVLEGDPLGHLSVSADGIVQRDELVFEAAVDGEGKRIPVVMLLSGGYQMCNAEVIARSLDNISEKYSGVLTDGE